MCVCVLHIENVFIWKFLTLYTSGENPWWSRAIVLFNVKRWLLTRKKKEKTTTEDVSTLQSEQRKGNRNI